MEDRIFGFKFNMIGGQPISYDDMRDKYLEHDVIYEVVYPIDGTNLLILGSWERDAIDSITQKLNVMNCEPVYISLNPVKQLLTIQFKYTGMDASQSTIWDVISHILTFGVISKITLHTPDIVTITSSISSPILSSVLIAGGALTIVAVFSIPILLNSRKSNYHTKW